MRITFDIPRMQERPLGMQIYIENVLKSILDLAPKEWHFSIRTMGLRGMNEHNARLSAVDSRLQALQQHLPIPETLYESPFIQGLGIWKPDTKNVITHSFGSRLIPQSSSPLVLAVQDVIPLRLQEGNSEFIDHTKRTLKALSERAQKLITISEFSKREISDILQVDLSKIEVIADGVDLDHYKIMPESEAPEALKLLKTLGLSKPYLLNVGGASKRKNKVRLIEAFEILKRQHDVPHSLVLMGEEPLNNELLRKIKDSQFADQIFNLGYLPNKHALWVLQQADALVFPSTYEGFGLPPLEAMACAVPVASSNASSLPEVCGDAAEYFDPESSEEMASCVYRILSDADLRKRCIDAGLKRSNSMTWQNNAKETLALYGRMS